MRSTGSPIEIPPAAVIRGHGKKTHAAAMHRPLAERLTFSLRRWRAQARRIAAHMQSAGFATVALIITTLMTFALSSRFPLINI